MGAKNLSKVVSLFAAAAAAAVNAEADPPQYTLATCDMSSRESFTVSWTGVAAVIAQSDDLDARCVGLAAVGADVGAFPVACDGNAPLFEAVSMEPHYSYSSSFFHVNTTAFAGLCLGTKAASCSTREPRLCAAVRYSEHKSRVDLEPQRRGEVVLQQQSRISPPERHSRLLPQRYKRYC